MEEDYEPGCSPDSYRESIKLSLRRPDSYRDTFAPLLNIRRWEAEVIYIEANDTIKLNLYSGLAHYPILTISLRRRPDRSEGLNLSKVQFCPEW